jgi:hypothetical protein
VTFHVSETDAERKDEAGKDLIRAIFGKDTAWRAAGRRQFGAAYAADDSVYELLIQDTPTR